MSFISVEIEPITDHFYLMNKPSTWTSFDVVKKMKYAGQFKKIGHAGTLDPLATGLLIICVGKYTKKIDYFQSLQKTYTGTFVLGKTTPSIDLETEFDHEYAIDEIDVDQIIPIANSFLGNSEQVPPIYSAIKLDGKRLYTHARNGVQAEDLAIKLREVSIYSFEVNADNFPEIDFKITCSKGTYIRSIVRDFGAKLQSGAYLKKLIRTAIGEFSLENAQSIASFDPNLYETL
jgi:tRNA pseudouridine55 synthase